MQPELAEECSHVPSVDKLIAELAKQRASLKEDMSILIQNSITPLQTSLEALHETRSRVASPEFRTERKLTKAETTIHKLDNVSLLDRLENWSRRNNLRIINVAYRKVVSEDKTRFVSKLLMETMGPEVFDKPPAP